MTGNPFLSIWMRPRATIQQIVAEDPQRYVLLLAGLAGIGESLNRAVKNSLGDKTSLEIIVALAVFLGPLGGLFSLWMYSHLVHWTGKWIGGTAPRETLKTAIAWACIPYIAGMVLWIPLLVMIGPELFTTETPALDADAGLKSFYFTAVLIQLILAIWTFILLSKTVAEVQGFISAWRGFANLLLAFFTLVVVIIGVALCVVVITSIARGISSGE